ncbi:putative tellurite resistance protein TerB [Methanocella conradii HZ254]|uniref:Tellurite resistance protein TerB n=1 Tax=Methanocella conradii (strain DSM 24694 / JCM 17849 / CGMCC 1.5162 / HZ254) TaxID=1041930 RepID=H8IAH3_METCZ|nr:tellurite resistance TerB family protein [Methanocella conradii]AFC99647.1 putative tellurite resistance protein TerB [Methanocella conradii HZ254]MDI6897489.1 tellurite resistance TerB family protein [Methanocella conradii]
MGLFDKVLGGSQPARFNAQEAFIGISLTAVAADGVINQDEAQGLFTALLRMKLFKGVNDGQMRQMFDRVLNLLKKQGAGAVINLSKEALTPEQKQTAFAIAADLVLADGVVEDEEKKYLDDLQKALEVPDDMALKVVETMVIKNRA